MNKTAAEAKALVEELKPLVANLDADVVVCPTFTSLTAAVDAAAGSNVKVGAQNIHWAENGAFTGEISAEMLKEIGVEYVIIGHSERRQYFGETDATVNQRLKAALAAELTVMVCVGELLEEREGGRILWNLHAPMAQPFWHSRLQRGMEPIPPLSRRHPLCQSILLGL